MDIPHGLEPNRWTRPTRTPDRSRSLTRMVLPQGLIIPAGADPLVADLIAVVNQPDHRAWMRQVNGIGGCSHPIHLRGYTRTRDSITGQIVKSVDSRDMPHGVLMVRCGNRRAVVCPSCAYIYRGDVYQLVRAGLEGRKGVPETVAAHPRVFVTLTAPAFGPIHTVRALPGGGDGPCHPRRTPVCEHGRRTACFAAHADDDDVVGTPLCVDCYDYDGAVIWQAMVGRLWGRTTLDLKRHLAKHGGQTVRDVLASVRLSYVKVIEYQRRGLVHIHAVIRADGIPEDPDENTVDQGEGEAPLVVVPPPEWVTAALMADAVTSTVSSVRLPVDGGPAGSWSISWGSQLDVHDVTARPGDEDASKIAAYVAKYASKGTEVTGWQSWRGPENLRGLHAERMVNAAVDLAKIPELAELKLGRCGKELGYGGHVSSKSRAYSTTLGKLRQARKDYHASAGQNVGGEQGTLVVESEWEVAGFGYTPGQAFIAAQVAGENDAKRAAAREAGAARTRAGGRDKLRGDDGVRERGARVPTGDGE